MSGIVVLLIVFALILLIAGWAVSAYNSLVRARNAVDEAWSQIDTQLQRRFDLIPNLVETVKGYASHEKETLQSITDARTLTGKAHKTGNPSDVAAAEKAFKEAMVAINAVAENYPQLQASGNFLKLQEELSTTENKVSFARQNYNDTTRAYNDTVQVFPKNIIAGMFDFKEKKMFEVDSAEVRSVPKVQF